MRGQYVLPKKKLKKNKKTVIHDRHSLANQLLHCAGCHDSDGGHAPKSKGKASDLPVVVQGDPHAAVHRGDVIHFAGGLFVAAKVLALHGDTFFLVVRERGVRQTDRQTETQTERNREREKLKFFIYVGNR